MSKQTRDKDFEERLLDRLKAVVAERGTAEAASDAAPAAARPGRHRPLRLALVGAAALAVAAVILIVASGGDNGSKAFARAFAVEPQKGGGVTIKIYSLENATGLEKALERAGIPAQVNWLPPGTTCREQHLKPSMVKTSMGGRMGGFEIGGRGPAMTIGVMSPQQYRELWRAYKRREHRRGGPSPSDIGETIPKISFDPGSFRPNQSIVISGSPTPFDGDPEGGYQARLQVVEGPVAPCDRVPAPASSIGDIDLPGGTEADASDAADYALPGAGQSLYSKTKLIQLQGWEPDGRGAGSKAKPRHFTTNLLGPEADAMPAFVSTVKEVWTGPDGKTRVRETLAGVEFLSAADQRHWESAGSLPPFTYDPSEHAVKRDSSGHLVKGFASRNWRGRNVFVNVPKLAKLPTEPEALRSAIEGLPSGSSPSSTSSRRGTVTAERLLEILSEPVTGPALRAAAFNALAEMPGIRLEHDVADVAGRRGDALTWVRDRGFGQELIFDPRTSRVLAQAEVIFGPPSTGEYGIPPGTPFRETAFLRSRIVDSTE